MKMRKIKNLWRQLLWFFPNKSYKNWRKGKACYGQIGIFRDKRNRWAVQWLWNGWFHRFYFNPKVNRVSF